MRNILIWVGIVALSLQDYFKKPIKPTRQQQFLETGGTAQVFIAGNKKVKCKCGWTWKLSDGGNDPYVCHKCGYDNSTESIAGTNSIWNKILKLYQKNIVVDDDGYTYLIMPRSIAKKIWDMGFIEVLAFYSDSESVISDDEDWNNTKSYGVQVGVDDIDYLLIKTFKQLYLQEEKEEYLKLAEIAAGDWELALQIAKSQDLL